MSSDVTHVNNHLRLALAGDETALAALGRLEAALSLCRPVVDRYGRHQAKDDAYYAAAEALGIERRCSCGGIDAVPHATDHAPDCSIWDES